MEWYGKICYFNPQVPDYSSYKSVFCVDETGNIRWEGVQVTKPPDDDNRIKGLKAWFYFFSSPHPQSTPGVFRKLHQLLHYLKRKKLRLNFSSPCRMAVEAACPWWAFQSLGLNQQLHLAGRGVVIYTIPSAKATLKWLVWTPGHRSQGFYTTLGHSDPGCSCPLQTLLCLNMPPPFANCSDCAAPVIGHTSVITSMGNKNPILDRCISSIIQKGLHLFILVISTSRCHDTATCENSWWRGR